MKKVICRNQDWFENSLQTEKGIFFFLELQTTK